MACSNSIIQSSSSSALTTLNRKYDVFVSFRGTDTRYNFTDNLFAAFQRKGIFAFRDDTKLKKGESIAPELLRAIEASHIFIVVFSKNYASSTWCLQELENILECVVQVSRKRVLPVFYDVDPSEVRKQSGSYAEAFAKHEERFGQNSEKLRSWREALTQVANLSGWDLRDKPQSVEIEKIVEEIINTLGHKFSSLPNDLVGMHSSMEKLEKLLLLDSVDDVRVVGIWGMGGIGKTTLATILYDRISHQFDACCFIDDLSKIYRDDGPIGAQKQIIRQTLGKEHLQICNLYDGANLVRSRLGHARTLIILDNVDHIEQLKKLAVNRKWLAAGSRTIIISRDAHILKEYGVDEVYKVPLLNLTDSLQLFCQQALKCDNIMSNYEELVYCILNYANGLPLAIKALGSFLFGRDISEWRSALARLRESPNKDIMDVLRLSFDGLEKMEKEIFLDIACFFNGQKEKFVKNVLDCCGFHPEIGLRVLIDKSLISISEKGIIEMHSLLEELGRKIVQDDLSKEQRKWSRLWLHRYFNNVISENMEKKVEAVILSGEHQTETKILMAEALSKMSQLRLLILDRVDFSGNLSCLSNELRYVEWGKYPFMYLPSSFQPNQLVELILVDSSIKQLWKDKKYLPNLRTLTLRHSKNLIKMPDFREVPNLEWLDLTGCIKLEQIDPSIGVLKRLVYLSLHECRSLVNIPNNMVGLTSLEYLNLFGCYCAFNTPLHKVGSSESESNSQSTTTTTSSFIFKWITSPFRSKQPLDKGITYIPSCLSPSLPSFPCLRKLDISYCGVSQIPDAIGLLHWLERLVLTGNNFVTLPSFRELSRLAFLNLDHCKRLKSFPELPLAATIQQGGHHHRIYSNTSGCWGTAGLCIFNCPELGEKERCNSASFSWMIQFMKANQQSSASFGEINIVTPGREMPWWFNYQRVGSSISIDPYPIMLHDDNDHNNIIGVACCAVFSAAPIYLRFLLESFRKPVLCLCFRSGDLVYTHNIPAHSDVIEVESKYVWLAYFTRESFFDLMSDIGNTVGNLVGMEVLVKKGMWVMNCGYSWVYKQDLQQFNAATMNRRDPLAPNRNFLAIEDEPQPQHNYSSDSDSDSD